MQKRGENHEHMPPAFNIMLSCFERVYEVNIVISPILCSRSSCLWNEIKLSNLQCGWSGFCIFYYPPSQMSYRALDEVMNIKVLGELVLSYSWSAHIKGCRNLLCSEPFLFPMLVLGLFCQDGTSYSIAAPLGDISVCVFLNLTFLYVCI